MPIVYCKNCNEPISVMVADYKRYQSGSKNAVPELCPKCLKKEFRRGQKEKVGETEDSGGKEFKGEGMEVRKGRRGKFGGFTEQRN